ncbi:MAG: hypothetical protein JSW13_01365 [Candidatus Aerophobus sp.]|nr:MAG: hypothetical protein JSW13_01365 [Candidatus Aerophobus sp.]
MLKKPKTEKAIATLIGCTRRKRRPKSITEIASIIEFLRKELGSYKAVGKAVGLSTEMLREFRSVESLDQDVKPLVDKRIIDSVDLVYRISKLNAKAQKAVIEKFLKNDLTGDDARVVKSFQRRSGQSIRNMISKIMKSRNIRTYILEFEMPSGKSKNQIRKRFEKIVGNAEIVSFFVNGKAATLALSYQGQKKLRERAKEKKITLRKFVIRLLKK